MYKGQARRCDAKSMKNLQPTTFNLSTVLAIHSFQTVLKVAATSYPAIFGRMSRLKYYKKELTLLIVEKIEAIRIYHSKGKAIAIEQSLHVERRDKYGHVHAPGLKSTEIYATKHLKEILDLLREREQQTISQLPDEKKDLY